MSFWRYYLACVFPWVFWEAELNIGLDMQETYQGKWLWKITSKKENKSRKEETQILMQVYHLWKEKGKEDCVGRVAKLF